MINLFLEAKIQFNWKESQIYEYEKSALLKVELELDEYSEEKQD